MAHAFHSVHGITDCIASPPRACYLDRNCSNYGGLQWLYDFCLLIIFHQEYLGISFAMLICLRTIRRPPHTSNFAWFSIGRGPEPLSVATVHYAVIEYSGIKMWRAIACSVHIKTDEPGKLSWFGKATNVCCYSFKNYPLHHTSMANLLSNSDAFI